MVRQPLRPFKSAAAVGVNFAESAMPVFTTKPLDPSTWPAFAALVERHNGVWSGCWCMSFHAEGKPNTRSVEQRRCDKETRVREGRAHAALVYDGDTCI